jgi:methylmalonyl-CoA mutase, N-terminal domain
MWHCYIVWRNRGSLCEFASGSESINEEHLKVGAGNLPSDLPDEIDAARQHWLREHSEELSNQRKDLFTTSSGREIDVVYTPADVPPDFSYLDDLGLPGEFPYTRGESATGYRGELWGFEFYAGFGSATDANRRYRYLLEQGSTGGVSIALDLPTQIGLDSDDPLAEREVGRVGVAIDSIQDVMDVFDGIDLSRAGKVFTTGNCIGPIAMAWFYSLAEARGESPDSVVVTIQNDPLKEYVARGTQFLPVAAAADLACDVVEWSVRQGLPWYPISVSGSHMKQAGGTCAQEAAFTLANATGYADRLHARGLDAAAFAPVMELHFCTDMDFFEEIAKYRVIRRVWAEILKRRYHVEGVAPRLHAATSGLPLTAQQPKNNIIRITLQALAQILGGVAQTRTASFDEALAIPSEDAVKLAIRTNQVIAHETGIPDTVDPLGGSYYLERLTRDMHEEVWAILNKVDDMGGAIRAVESGYFAQELADGAYRQQVELEEHRRVIVGVNEFVEEGHEALKLFKLDPDAARRQRERVVAAREARDRQHWMRAMEGLRSAISQGENSMPAVLDAVRAGATVGEIASEWRAAYGEYESHARRLA